MQPRLVDLETSVVAWEPTSSRAPAVELQIATARLRRRHFWMGTVVLAATGGGLGALAFQMSDIGHFTGFALGGLASLTAAGVLFRAGQKEGRECE
ncbi:MAG: hypothetical protein SF187_02035 [Deltaproteobacteria bacterium]|nr:hypothetical protein [Deltaproteobacteria bacterium]